MKLLNVILVVCEIVTIRSKSCDNVTDSHWNLFFRANAFTNYIRFESITENNPLASEYLENVLQRSYEHFGNPVFVSSLESGHEEPSFDFQELFSWTGAKLPLRDKQMNATMLIHDDGRLSSLQKDESHFLTFVMLENIDILDKYLYGSPRKPFYKTRARYIIAIREDYSEYFRERAATILRRLWVDYGISRALIVSTCQDQYFYQYDPFAPSKNVLLTGDGDIDVEIWGQVEESFFNDTNSLSRWAHNYPFNYNGYPMTSVMFKRLPTALPWTDLPQPFVKSYFCDARFHSTEFGGVDGIILGNLFNTLNFTPSVFKPVNEYGYQLDNKTYIGSIGDVLYSRAGFSSNGRFVQDYGTTEIEFMYPVFFDKFCVIAPKAQQIPQWLAVFRCFNPFVWTLFLLSTTALGYIWYLFKKWTSYMFKNRLLTRLRNEIVSPEHSRAVVSIIDMWLIMTSGVPSILAYHGVERIFMTGCLLLSITIGGTFQGSLTTSYSTRSYYKDINTLEELDSSNLPIGTSSRNLANIFESEGNPIFESLQRKFIIRREPAIDQAAFRRDICCIERASDIKVIITTTYELADGSALLHVVGDCPRSYHLSFIVRKGWPFLSRFNEVIMRLSEAGLLFEWYNQAENAIILSKRIERLQFLKDSLQAFSLEDMQTAFYMLIIGMSVCGVVFIVEVCLGRRSKRIVNKANNKKKKVNDTHHVIRPRKIYHVKM